MGNNAQVHNKAPETKAKLRLYLMRELGGAKKCRVIETHSGPAVMRRLAYNGVSDWLGIDQDPESPGAVHADNRLVLRAIDLGRFNLFDVDAFGSPWEQVWIVSRRRHIASGERIALAMTSGMQGALGARQQSLRAAGWSRQMQEAIDADVATKHRWFVGERFANHAAQRFVATWFDHCSIVKWLSARSAATWYFGCVLSKM